MYGISREKITITSIMFMWVTVSFLKFNHFFFHLVSPLLNFVQILNFVVILIFDRRKNQDLGEDRIDMTEFQEQIRGLIQLNRIFFKS